MEDPGAVSAREGYCELLTLFLGDLREWRVRDRKRLKKGLAKQRFAIRSPRLFPLPQESAQKNAETGVSLLTVAQRLSLVSE